MAGLSHENIVQFLGFVEDLENGKAWMVLGWEPNGNVSEFLAAGKREVPERISLVSNYLAGRRPAVSSQHVCPRFRILSRGSSTFILASHRSATAISSRWVE